MLNISNNAIIEAFEKGYRVVAGEVISPYKSEPLKPWPDERGYMVFAIRDSRNKITNIHIHRMVAYQKYGNALFEVGIETRHLDNDYLNNFEDNIAIGTHTENMQDIPKDLRLKKAIHTSKHIRKFTDDEVAQIRKFHKGSYKETMDRFNITSKGTLHHILTHKYVTKK